MQIHLKSELELKNRSHKVDEPRYEKPDDAAVGNIGLTETDACFTLPMKRSWWGIKKKMPKGEQWFDIEITGQEAIDGRLTDKDNTLTGEHFHNCPVTCTIQNAKRSSCGQFQVNSCKNHFTLYFDASRLKDCPVKLDNDRKFYLPFRLTIKDLKNGQPTDEGAMSFEDYLEITVKKYEPTLTFEFKPSLAPPRYTTESARQYQEVGKLVVSHSARFSCSPTIHKADFSLLSRLEGNQHNDRIYLQLYEGRTNQVNGLCLAPGDVKEYPVILDMQAVYNPKDESDAYEVLTDYHGVTSSCAKQFQLLRNPTLTRCKATFELPTNEGTKSIDLNTTSEHTEELWISRNNDQTYHLKLCFTNTADADDPQFPNAAVFVWGVSIDAVDVEGGIIQTSGNKSLKDIFAINGSGPWELNRRNGDNSAKCVLPIILKAGQIESITPAPDADKTYATICLHLTYYMLEDEEGKNYSQVMSGNTKELNDNALHQTIIRLRLEKDPHPGWMCVDFGTSAVVAAYAQGIQDNQNTLINLKEIKERMLEAVYGNNNPKLDINDEDNHLISSTVCFNNSNSDVYDNICPDGYNYLKLPVWFSPSAADLRKDYLLPCLKTIIGYKQLPNIFLDQYMEQFRYTTSTGEELKLIDDDGRATALMRVPEVSKMIYRQLFAYYLSQRYDQRNETLVHRNVNKLVLSVPNTFTPINIAAVKRLAREAMPEIYPEHLRTVSESDAVACYYVAHHDDFLDNSQLSDSQKNELRRQERVLVFDMGAGTLDLTWFEKKEDGDGKTTVTIKGKLGVSKAGNYLDYELGYILQELYSEGSKSPKQHKLSERIRKALIIDRSTSIREMSDSDMRFRLKNYVKELKKSLNGPTTDLPTLTLDGEEYPPLKADNILDNKHFSDVIREMTADVLHTFGHRHNKTDGKLDIDVVIFSGRSTRLKAIRESVKDNIGSICTQPDKILFADICSKKLQKGIEQASDEDHGITLKTIVTEGALAYASLFVGSNYKLITQPFYASYGLMKCGRRKGYYEYVPLIEEAGIHDGCKTIVSQRVNISTGDFRQIDLIQSYSCDPEADYRNGNFDTISKLYTETISESRDDFKVRLTMNIESDDDESVGLIFEVGQGTAMLDAHDDFNNNSLRKSLWPVIFDNKKDEES